ncbi:PREDICTED: LOW QUALITY PROTEIN: bromodomain-containing protein 8 [Dufourea novaeangliae]|uniref:LOW QUALITY PROTEIN: bromodomain-containing protein 8 n=1 Tax=Dufourea novaeangliae TaxID=178035 RepID=UPI000766E2EA|nr:PREDICTED: LOW QUALITY PROTEIN: bromodomain-containing protein 8 [Dufourea novaeangliae]
MTSVQDRLKLKRSYDNWSTREQLCLASGVLKSGDQNWMSVSRSLKAIIEKDTLRPPDWFSQKSCAIQYAHLLENADTPKRKKRESGETTGESIVRKLTQERIVELGQILAFQRDEYQQLKAEINMLKSGGIAEDKLQKMWHTIEQEEREQEQKARAHSAWLAKRQQKQELSSPQALSAINQRRSTESSVELQETTETVDEDEKKSRGGRSPLLTSLLKSPSPTTQIQTSTTTAQVSSPTITSLLGSSPKVPNTQLTQNVSPQLHQLVSTAITNTPPERPSVGAPTLSMLLEMPANAQRGPLPNLQSTSTIVSQQNATTEIHTLQPQPVHQLTIQGETPVPAQPLTINPPNIPVTESMVQIIDNIDDVIRKDIMADVIDKDEINEIIGDIEELIKEEITGSPQTLDTATTTINTLTIPPIQEVPIVSERPEPRDVDEVVSLSNSPESEMAIEEIDSSTSNIAEIIGTVAIEPQEPKVIVAKISETVPSTTEQIKSEESTSHERVALTDELVPEVETQDGESSSEEKPIVEEFVDTIESTSNAETEEKDCKIPTRELDEMIEDEIEEEEETEVVVPEAKKSPNNKLQRESSEELDNKGNMELDQLEMHLAKITGEQQDTPSAEVVSVSSEVTNDIPSTEDTEKSQDISLILEDDESIHSADDKKKITEEQIIENTVESTESIESFKEEPVIVIKEKTIIEVSEESPQKSQEEHTEETLEIYTDEFKKEDTKDSSEDTTSSILQDIEIKEEEIEETSIVEDSTQLVSREEIENLKQEIVDPVKTETDIPSIKKEESTFEESKIEEESKIQLENTILTEIKKEDIPVKEDKEDKKTVDVEQNIKKETESIVSAGEDTVELDEEESSLSKLSGGRAMKTYSKKQNASIDSEPENEATGEGADYRAWKKAVMLVYNRLATHKYASVFLRPITEDQAPGYHSVIFRPMDLSTIKKNIDNGTIRSTMHFQRDVMLMFQNAIMYNKHDTFIYKMAVSMQEECLQHMQILVQVTGEGTLRRETRTAASSSSEASESSIKRKRSHITPSPHDTDSPRSKKRRKSEND